MNRFVRTSLKWSLRLIVALTLLLTLWFTTLAFPYPLFSHVEEFEICTLHSDVPLDADLRRAGKEAAWRLEGLEIHDPMIRRDIFICQKQKTFSLIARLALQPTDLEGFNLSVVGNSFLNLPRIAALAAATAGLPRYSLHDGDVAHMICHEIIHEEMVDVLGFPTSLRLPRWKSEGYVEYGCNIQMIRADRTATLEARIAVLDDDAYWYASGDWARFCWKSALMVEYLAEVEGYSFADIMADSVGGAATYSTLRRRCSTRPVPTE